MIPLIAILGTLLATVLAIQLLGSYEEIPVLSCLLVVFGLAMVVRGDNFSAAAAFIATPLPIVHIKNQQKARIWRDLQGQETRKGKWRCPEFYNSFDWDDSVQGRQEWWDG